ncbi:MAG: hypothetical protein JXB88_04835 [Spirochaetales bacterium]|nr:hypothetical protein [Spirochaetales bacterium]
MRSIKRFSIIIAVIIIICSCAGIGAKKEPEEKKNPYDDFPPIFPALEAKSDEATPEAEDKGPKPTPTPRETIRIKGRILEYNKATKVVYINVGSSTKGIRVGLEGKIYNDNALTQENGIVTLTKVYPEYSEGAAKNQNYEINPMAAIAVFEIDK